jgi:hypothetical protein
VAIAGQNLAIYNPKTVEECKQLCEEETLFHCQSFDYQVATQKCFLQVASRYTSALGNYAGYVYYERNCQSEDSFVLTLN